MLIKYLYLFQRQKPDISISALRYGLVCFCLFLLISVPIMLEHHEWI